MPRRQKPSKRALALRVAFEGAVDFFCRNRQIADARADGVCHGGSDRWRDWRERALTDALDLVGTDTVCRLHQHRRQRWSIGHGWQLVFAKGRIRHSTVLDLQLLSQGVADALHDGTLNLALVPDRIDDLTDVMGCGEAQHLYLACLRINSDLGDLHREGSDVRTPALLDVRTASDRCAGTGEQVWPAYPYFVVR